jgi:hypothetical protein
MVGMEMERKGCRGRGWSKWRVEDWGVLGYYQRPRIRRIQDQAIVEALSSSTGWSIRVVVVWMEQGIPRVRVIAG